jgi:hypothetical protein
MDVHFGRSGLENPDKRHRGLLRPRCERHKRCHTSSKRKEFPPPHASPLANDQKATTFLAPGAVLCTTANAHREMSKWVKSDVSGALADVGFYPESDRLLRRRKMTLCAISDQSAPQQK